MKQKELKKPIMMISNLNKPFGLQGFYRNIYFYYLVFDQYIYIFKKQIKKNIYTLYH